MTIAMVCHVCGKEFRVKPGEVDKRKHCSKRCQGISFETSMKGENNPGYKGRVYVCLNCNKKVDRRRNLKHCSECGAGIPEKYLRKYCDDCWRDYMTSRRGGLWRKDHNQDLIVDALKKAGCSVLDLSMVGGGCPDLMVGKHGFNFFMEVKNPDTKGKLNDLQKKFIEEWDAPIHVVRTADEALKAIGVME